MDKDPSLQAAPRLRGGEVFAAKKLIEQAGGDARQAFLAAGTDAVRADLRARTEEAASLGIFGAPTFIADGELFWGDDRLEEAVAWCAGLHPALQS
jgi:2-hydroxychromene-2-carboxylate isomerase